MAAIRALEAPARRRARAVRDRADVGRRRAGDRRPARAGATRSAPRCAATWRRSWPAARGDPAAHPPGRAAGQVRRASLAEFAAPAAGAQRRAPRSTRTARGRTPSWAATRWRWRSRWPRAGASSPSSRGGGRFSLPFGEIERLYAYRAMADEGEIQRLESLWSEDFGDSYVERNQAAAAGREPLWRVAVRAPPVHERARGRLQRRRQPALAAQLDRPERVCGDRHQRRRAAAGPGHDARRQRRPFGGRARCRSATRSSSSRSPPAC